ncbi:MAG: TIGR00269 family protein [Candidatus Woesearchaeota archaeon]
MKCFQCNSKAIIELQHGAVCEKHFLHYFEDKVFKTLQKYQLIDANDKVCVACSGGKDSQTVLYLVKKYLLAHNLNVKDLKVLAIDEGIKNYRSTTLKDLKKFCQEQQVELKIIEAKKEFKYTLDATLKKLDKNNSANKPCHICGVWRRYLINKYAREMKCTKLVTGHNLDDEAQAIVMNIFKANTSLSAHLGPISGIQDHELFVRRVKPLYFCPEKEVRLYSILKRFPVRFVECPYAEEGYRAKIRDMLNEFESKYKGTKQGIIGSFLEILPLIKEKEIKNNKNHLKQCRICGEPANRDICHACKIVERLK